MEVPEAQKIRLVLNSLGGGGAEHVAVELCRQWANEGVKVQVVLLREGGVRVVELPSSVELHVLDITRARYALPKLSAWEKTHGTCATLVFGFEAAFVFALGKFLGRLQSPLIFREGSLPEANLSWPRRAAYPFVLAKSDAVVVQSSSMARKVSRSNSCLEKITAIPNPVRRSSGDRKSVVEKEWGRREPVRILSIGRLSPEKGFGDLVQAFREVRQSRPMSDLTIYGEGAERKRLQGLITRHGLQGSVKLPGFRMIDQAIWRRSDIFVLSSRYEGQPNALMQAISVGMRVIATSASPATIELLHACGLEQSVISCISGVELRRKVDWCLETPATLWSQASTRLLEMSDAVRIAQRYLECLRRVA